MSMPTHQPEYGTISSELAMLRHELSQNTIETRKITHLLTGNGEPAKGLIVRMDRLEQNDKRLHWWTNAALVAGVGAFVETIWSRLTGSH